MPISKEEFEKGRTTKTITSMVEELLQNNAERAFTVGEIIDELYGKPSSTPMIMFQFAINFLPINAALDSLINEGKVTRKSIQQEGKIEDYYIWRS
jgi:hypothetical protein